MMRNLKVCIYMFSKTIEKEIVIHKYINVNLIRNICKHNVEMIPLSNIEMIPF